MPLGGTQGQRVFQGDWSRAAELGGQLGERAQDTGPRGLGRTATVERAREQHVGTAGAPGEAAMPVCPPCYAQNSAARLAPNQGLAPGERGEGRAATCRRLRPVCSSRTRALFRSLSQTNSKAN